MRLAGKARWFVGNAKGTENLRKKIGFDSKT